jgi:molecular chaperone Hsp33
MNEKEKTDFLLPFQLDRSHLRGRVVRLGPLLDDVLKRHAYPPRVASLLGEAMVIAVALSASLKKFDGVFTLQAKGDGAVRLLVADVTGEGAVRAYAQYDAAKLDADKTAVGDLTADLLGKGYLVFTVDYRVKDERYQGIVELEGGTLAEAVQHYFRQSEQIPTGILAATHQDEQGHWHGGCLLLQKMPREGGVAVEVHTPEAEDWIRAMTLMSTCTQAELTTADISSEALLYRLFHEEGVRVYPARPLRHQCRCSEDKVRDMLRGLPRGELTDLAEESRLKVDCEFCSRSYVFELSEF